MKSKYTLIFHPEAEKEYLESVEWYENSLIGLGKEFVNEIDKTIGHINKSPLLFPIRKLQLREA